MHPRGFIVYQGPSVLSGAPILGLITLRNTNRALGDPRTVQLWIVPKTEVNLARARALGIDSSVCGDCALRPILGGECFVSAQPLASISAALARGIYPARDPAELGAELFGNTLRLGAWGDPGALPEGIVASLAYSAKRWIGHTHQWRRADAQHLRAFCMASIDAHDPPEALAQAWALGWRTYRMRRPGDPVVRGEARCPKSSEAGGKRTCADCPFGCAGASSHSATILDHGPKSAIRRRARELARG